MKRPTQKPTPKAAPPAPAPAPATAPPPPTPPPAAPLTTLDANTLALIKAADLANIVKKVKAGKPLSTSERQILEAQAAKANPPAPVADAPAKPPKGQPKSPPRKPKATFRKPTVDTCDLTLRQARFCTEYMRCGNGSEAARRAGYSPTAASVEAHRLLANDKIKARIKQAWEELAMTGAEIIGRLSEHARGDISEFLTDEGEVSMLAVKEKGHLIRKLKRTKEGIDMELHDPQSALAHLAKIRRLFAESETPSPPPGCKTITLEFAHPADEVVHQ